MAVFSRAGTAGYGNGGNVELSTPTETFDGTASGSSLTGLVVANKDVVHDSGSVNDVHDLGSVNDVHDSGSVNDVHDSGSSEHEL